MNDSLAVSQKARVIIASIRERIRKITMSETNERPKEWPPYMHGDLGVHYISCPFLILDAF
jgi:hypothetical protein